MKNILILLTFIPLVALSSPTSEQVNDLDERLTDLELRGLKHKVDFSMELHLLGGYIDRENTKNHDDDYSSDHFKNTFRLKAKASVTKEFKMYASLQVSSLFNDEVQTNNKPTNSILSPTQGSSPYLRTAYFDWNLTDRLAFSAGRLPTTFGPPEHMKHGRARLGTYPLASFNLPLDGLSITYKIPGISDVSMSARTIYIPGSLTTASDPQDGAKVNSASKEFLENHQGITQMFEAEYEPSSSKYLSSLLFIAQYSYLRLGSFKETEVHSYVTQASKKVLTRIYADEDTLSHLQIMTGYLEVNDVLKSPLDLYYSYMRSSHNNSANILTEVDGTIQDQTQFVTQGNGQGTRSIYGFRYKLKESFFGAEYWKTTSNPAPNALYSDDFIALGQIAGETYHLYFTKMFFSNDVSLRFGVVKINEDKNFEEFGYSESSNKITSLYSSIFITY